MHMFHRTTAKQLIYLFQMTNGMTLRVFYYEFSETREYCQNEKFTGECGRDEVILMEKAVYGRMSFSRCIERDYGYVVSYLL